MQSKANSVTDYLNEVAEDKKSALKKLRGVVKKSIPKGFEECMNYGMIGYVVPHSIYPKGYHCDPKLPLPFVGLGAQKNFIALYHMGIYASPTLLKWFVAEYPKHSKHKLDMGKSCIRFKKPDDIPYDLITELMQKITVDAYIKTVEEVFTKSKK